MSDYLTTYSLLGEDQMITMSIDITERKRAEKALQRSKDELEQKVLERYKGTERERRRDYRDLADSITDLFFAMSPDLRYTYWNRASEEILHRR